MKVSELIAALQSAPQDASVEIGINDYNGTYIQTSIHAERVTIQKDTETFYRDRDGKIAGPHKFNLVKISGDKK